MLDAFRVEFHGRVEELNLGFFAEQIIPNLEEAARDYIFIVRDAAAQVNAVFTQLFTIMGVYPVIYASLLFPAGRSGNKVALGPLALSEIPCLSPTCFAIR